MRHTHVIVSSTALACLLAGAACILGESTTPAEPNPAPPQAPSAAGFESAKPAGGTTTEAAAPLNAAEAAAMVGQPGAGAVEASRPIGPPPGWKGTGELARRKGPLPKGVPAWVGIEARVIDKNGQKFLVASGIAENIANPALAISTAANRARAILTQWVHDDKLDGSQVSEQIFVKRKKLGAAQVELPIPADWTPGQSLQHAAPAPAEP